MGYSIKIYETKNGKRPFEIWLDKLDRPMQYKIIAKVERVCQGNLSSCYPIGDSISEIKLDVGPGYRIYYSIMGSKIILLLCGGTKSGQQKDIDKAKEYLKDYKNRGKI